MTMNSSDMQFNNSQLAAYAKFLAGLALLLSSMPNHSSVPLSQAWQVTCSGP